MATYEEIMNAARNADAAGDEDAARRLVQMAQAQSAQTRDEGLATLSEMTQNPSVVNGPDMSFTGRLRDNVIGVDDGIMTTGEKIGQAINGAGEAATFGVVGDEADSAVKSALGMGDYDIVLDRNRRNQAQFREENPYLSVVTEVAGGLLVPGGIAKQGAGLLQKSALGGLTAGAGGGLYGFMEGEGDADERLQAGVDTGLLSGVLGALAPGAGQLLAKGVDRVRGNRAIREAVQSAPSMQELRSRASALFDRAQAGTIPQQGVLDLSRRIAQEGRASGMDDVLTPLASRASANLSDLADNAGYAGGLPLRELEIMRRQAGVAAGDMTNRTQSAVGSQMIEAIDDHVDSVAASMGDMGKEARRMWGTLRRSELVDQAFERARLAASGFENGLQIEFRRILRSPQLSRGFTDAQKKAMESVVNGGPLHGLLRQVGRLGFSFDGGSNAVGGVFGTAIGALQGPVGAIAIPTIGTLARKGSEALRARTANRAADLVRTMDMPNLPQISQQGRGLIEDVLLRSARSAGIASEGP